MVGLALGLALIVVIAVLPSGLERAAMTGDVAAIHEHLERGANPNRESRDLLRKGLRRTPMLWAIHGRSPEAIGALAQGGALVRPHSFEYLRAAIEVECCDCIDELLSHGASANAAGPDGTTALFLALERGDAAIAINLLVAGANPLEENDNGVTPLAVAVGMVGNGRLSAPECKDLLVAMVRNGMPVDARLAPRQGDHRRMLMWAAEYAEPQLVSALLDMGSDKCLVDLQGAAARDYALQGNDSHVSELLQLLECD